MVYNVTLTIVMFEFTIVAGTPNCSIQHAAMAIAGLGSYTMFSEKLFLWLLSGPGLGAIATN